METTNQLFQAPRLHLRRPAHLGRLISLIVSVFILGYLFSRVLNPLLLWAWFGCNLLAWSWEIFIAFNKNSSLNLTETSVVYRRHYRRMILFASVVIINLGTLFSLSFLRGEDIDSLALGLVIYNLLTFAWLEYETFRWFIRGHNAEIWISLSAIAGFCAGWTIWKLHPKDIWLGVGIGFLTALMNGIIFVMQRLGSEDRVRGDVIRSIILQILGVEQTHEKWKTIVEQIHKRLKYDHVTILEPSMDRTELVVVAEIGSSTNHRGRRLPVEEGITGKAFVSGAPEAWNNVSKCPYYKRLVEASLDKTRAEIAVPIQHQGITYGILDAQSHHKNAFRWDDKQMLEVIAHILGVAVSAQKTDLLIREASQLWDELSRHYYNEESIFHEFARFAQEKLGADVVTYFPLTPSGYPAKPPYHLGKLFVPDRLSSPIQKVDSPVIKLIHDWQPQFIETIAPDSLLGQWGLNNPESFTVRERVQSVCFVPVGTSKERLGAMFLNYREARHFDGLFQFMVMSFSQTFAILASQGRFKDVVFEGFGRPELGVHNLLGRYGFKTGVVEEGQKIFLRSCLNESPTDFKQCGMSGLLSRMDEFLQAVSLANSSIPPLFWDEMLKDELEKFASTLPVGKSNRRPLAQLRIDVLIERESAWVKLALYRLITEAMNNAVFHGEATTIKVQVRRDAYDIIIRVINDGQPLPQDSNERQSSRGIFSLLMDFNKMFDARTSIEPGPNNEGTIVQAVLPAIPFNFEVPHEEKYFVG